MLVDCSTCKWNSKSPYLKDFDKCEHPSRGCNFSGNERSVGNCGVEAIMYEKRTTLIPRFQKYDYFHKYAPLAFFYCSVLFAMIYFFIKLKIL